MEEGEVQKRLRFFFCYLSIERLCQKLPVPGPPSFGVTLRPIYIERMAAIWRQIFSITGRSITIPVPATNTNVGFPRFFSKSTPYIVKVGIPEFLNGVGGGVETHAAKLETEIGELHKLLVTRTLKLKKLGIPCKHRKLILKYSHKYRLGLWRPRADLVKS
ncbi:hypothetical protein Nepgr_001625 [Nepenthes gracilis]|uniref:Small ribosomal subunit protein mS41 SAM domain-containing protein n=1 Tax=Nepenthes gracilis TaxID=150966 RepID=A0AAD3P4T6_NEPGR|nr:hypothetical protein Nepgr_001625 [Nepenthes gracilis]